jgi:hypothetical protein
MMWNSSLDPEELNAEYLRVAFGPAAHTMGEFYELWIPDNSPIVSKNLIYEVALKVQQADKEAAARPDVLARLNDVKQYLRFLQLDWTLQSMGRSGEYSAREAAFIDLMKHLMRSQESRMNEVALAQQNLFQVRGEQSGIIQVLGPTNKVLVNPQLSPRDKENPWKINTPYTAEEIAANWQSTLEYFKSDVIAEQKYSRDLVAIDWQGAQATGVKADVDSLLEVQGSAMHWVLYSLKGEPLAVSIFTMSKVDVKWTLHEDDGNAIRDGVQRGDVPEAERAFNIKVPHAGAYYLDVMSGNFVTVAIPQDCNASYALQRGAALNPQGPLQMHQPRCFYVPKGTKNIQLFTGATPDKPVKVDTPDGKAVDVAGFREWAIVPVPAGMDGKVWRVDAALRSLWFANCPPYVAAAPERLLVPRDLALRDGLTIRTR